jgi:hypothetical protein
MINLWLVLVPLQLTRHKKKILHENFGLLVNYQIPTWGNQSPEIEQRIEWILLGKQSNLQQIQSLLLFGSNAFYLYSKTYRILT